MSCILIGSNKSGRSLVAAILNCSSWHISITSSLVNLNTPRKIYIYNGPINLESLNHLSLLPLRYVNLKCIWIIRNPLDSSCSYINHNFADNAQNAFDIWYNSNMVMWYGISRIAYHMKYEDVIMEKRKIKGLFDFCDLEFNDQYINFGDFDQPRDILSLHGNTIESDMLMSHPLSEQMSSLWNKNKHLVFVKKMQYNNMEE